MDRKIETKRKNSCSVGEKKGWKRKVEEKNRMGLGQKMKIQILLYRIIHLLLVLEQNNMFKIVKL